MSLDLRDVLKKLVALYWALDMTNGYIHQGCCRYQRNLHYETFLCRWNVLFFSSKGTISWVDSFLVQEINEEKNEGKNNSGDGNNG